MFLVWYVIQYFSCYHFKIILQHETEMEGESDNDDLYVPETEDDDISNTSEISYQDMAFVTESWEEKGKKY